MFNVAITETFFLSNQNVVNQNPIQWYLSYGYIFKPGELLSVLGI